MSAHAKRIITQFMAACCGKSKTEDSPLGQQAMDPNEEEKNENCAMSLQSVHQVLKEAANLKSNGKKNQGGEKDINEVSMSEQMKCSLRLGAALWSLDATAWSGDAIDGNGHRALANADSSSSQKVFVFFLLP